MTVECGQDKKDGGCAALPPALTSKPHNSVMGQHKIITRHFRFVMLMKISLRNIAHYMIKSFCVCHCVTWNINICARSHINGPIIENLTHLAQTGVELV